MNKINSQKGFTLIEMLVVIAVIGILAATVLTSLGPARDKAKDTRIISALNQARAVAETTYDGTSGTYSDLDATSTSATYDGPEAEITNNGGSSFTIRPLDSSKEYVIFAKLNDGSTVYCVDSIGNTETLKDTGPTTGTFCDGTSP